MIARAADIRLQAARAYLAADDGDAAAGHAKGALQLLVRGKGAGRVPKVLARVQAALRNKGYNSQADTLGQEAGRLLGEMGMSLDDMQQQMPQARVSHGTLPAACDSCGAPLVPDDVDWHDAQTAECPYCGTVLKAS